MPFTTLLFKFSLLTSILILSGVYGRPFSEEQETSATKVLSYSTKLKGKIVDGGDRVYRSDTVPILRTNGNTSSGGHYLQTSNAPWLDHCIAVVRTQEDANKKFYGAEGSPSLNKPAASGAQWTAARMKLTNGQESIEVGWMVNPSLFKDQEAHLYVRFQRLSRVGPNSCINTACPGFVQVNKDIPLGITPDVYSQYGGQQFTWRLFIDKHQDDGNWWVSTEDDKKPIGYWPKSLFSGLADHASVVEWGGEADNPGLNVRPIPEMGYGDRPDYNSAKSAFYQHVTVVDESFHNVNPDKTLKVWNCPEQYEVLDWGYQGDYWGRLIFYGGPIY